MLTPENQPLACVQEAGEIVYVPEGWNHATTNVGQTIALAQQRHEPRAGGYLDYVKQALTLMGAGNLPKAQEAVQKARELEPVHFHAMLAEAMLKQNQVRQLDAPRTTEAHSVVLMLCARMTLVVLRAR